MAKHKHRELETDEPICVKGKVVDCVKLNIRLYPDVESPLVCAVDCDTVIEVYEKESTSTFYKVCLAAGIEGFCMRKFVEII